MTEPADQAGFASYPSLRGRTVFITGGATGIGAEFVGQFARQGAQVGFVDIQAEPAAKLAAVLAAELGTAPWYQACDVSDVPRLRDAISACAAELGPIDVLINNAADDERRPVEEMTEQFWDTKFGVNLRPMFFAAQAVAPAMRARQRGSIINLGSITWHAGFANVAAYATAKAAIEGLTRSLARDLDLTVTRSLILSGGGAYADPWHPFAATSERIAEILAALGHHVEISELVADRVADLRGWDLIVVNAASSPQADTRAAQAGLMAALDRGLGVLAIHVGACTLLRLPAWESVTGAAWITGRSMHPKAGPCRIITYPGRHPICAPVADFDITDERYAYLRTAPDIVPLAAHEHAGELHPLRWARVQEKSRIVTDLLGHDGRSYDNPEHRELISRAARWLTGAI